MVNVSEARHRQTWEGRYIYDPSTHDRLRNPGALVKTTIRCPLCQLRFLRKVVARPIGRVIYVEGPPDARLRQPVIYDPLPRSVVVLVCTSRGHEDGSMTFTMTHRKFREMESATKSIPSSADLLAPTVGA